MINNLFVPEDTCREAPPGEPVEWQATVTLPSGEEYFWRRPGGERVMAQTWYAARLAFLRLLGCEPDEIEVEQIEDAPLIIRAQNVQGEGAGQPTVTSKTGDVHPDALRVGQRWCDPMGTETHRISTCWGNGPELRTVEGVSYYNPRHLEFAGWRCIEDG